jgi:hypothetical protein
MMIILGIIVERLITYLDDNWVNPGGLLTGLITGLITGWKVENRTALGGTWAGSFPING